MKAYDDAYNSDIPDDSVKENPSKNKTMNSKDYLDKRLMHLFWLKSNKQGAPPNINDIKQSP